MRTIKLLIIYIGLSLLSCKEYWIGDPDCISQEYGAIKINNNTRDRYTVSIKSVSISASVDAGGYLLVNNVPTGPQKVDFWNESDAGNGYFNTEVISCETSQLEIK